MATNSGEGNISPLNKIHLGFALYGIQDCEQEVIVFEPFCKKFGFNPLEGIFLSKSLKSVSQIMIIIMNVIMSPLSRRFKI